MTELTLTKTPVTRIIVLCLIADRDRWMDGWMDRWIGEQVGEWMEGQAD